MIDQPNQLGTILTLRKTIKCLLIYPNPESALDEEAGKQLLADYEGYSKVSPEVSVSWLVAG